MFGHSVLRSSVWFTLLPYIALLPIREPISVQSLSFTCPLSVVLSTKRSFGQPLCLDCDAGTAAPVRGLAKCVPCDAGRSSSKVRSFAWH